MPHPTFRPTQFKTADSRLERAGLPTTHDIHWSLSRKEDVVRAVRDNLISFDEARWRYLLSRREFESWERSVDRKQAGSRALELS